MQINSTVSTEAASEDLDDSVLGLNTLKMEIKKADDMIHKHLGKMPHGADASKQKLMIATYARRCVDVLDECRESLGRIETETDLIEESAGKEALQNEAALVARILHYILETQSVQETVKKMARSCEKFWKAWKGWEELDRAKEELDKAEEELLNAWFEWEYARKEARGKAREKLDKAWEEVRLKLLVVEGVRRALGLPHAMRDLSSPAIVGE